MKNFGWLGYFAISFVISCANETVIYKQNQNEQVVEAKLPNEENAKTVHYTSPKTKQVMLIFEIQAEFPAGTITPDAVYMDNHPVQEGTKIWTGSHSFRVEKNGYHPKQQIMYVHDNDGDGIYRLNLTLNTKDRVILFNIIDKNTGHAILPDKVTIAPTDIQTLVEGKIITHQSLVKPGIHKIVIQKNGYQTISVDVNIKPDETPYTLNYQMIPVS